MCERENPVSSGLSGMSPFLKMCVHLLLATTSVCVCVLFQFSSILYVTQALFFDLEDNVSVELAQHISPTLQHKLMFDTHHVC